MGGGQRNGSHLKETQSICVLMRPRPNWVSSSKDLRFAIRTLWRIGCKPRQTHHIQAWTKTWVCSSTMRNFISSLCTCGSEKNRLHNVLKSVLFALCSEKYMYALFVVGELVVEVCVCWELQLAVSWLIKFEYKTINF